MTATEKAGGNTSGAATAKAADRRRRWARYTVCGLMAVFLLLASAFAIGGIFDDPGGTSAVVVTLLWVVPTVALTVYTFFRPARGEQVLMVVTGIVVMFIVVQALTGMIPTDDVGPVGTIVALAVSVPLALLGLHRAGMAGKLLVAVGLALALSGLLGAPAGSATALAAPLLIFGILFLMAAEPPGGRRRQPVPPTTT